MSGSKTEYLLASLPAPAKVSDEDKRRAQLTVARHALDPEDCRELIDMLFKEVGK